MSESTKGRFRTGKEALERFVPGYDAGKKNRDESVLKPKELKDKVLAGLREKLENLDVTRSAEKTPACFDGPNHAPTDSAEPN